MAKRNYYNKMRGVLIYLLLILLVAACSTNPPSKVDIKRNNWLQYFSENVKIKAELNKLYPNDETGMAFKVLISRRDQYVRVNIYQIKSLDFILEDLPAAVFHIENDIFLLYDGSEVISSKISREVLLKDLSKYKLTENIIVFNPKVLQFDIDLNKHITFNSPPINPYDIEVLDSIKFPLIREDKEQ